MHFHQHKTIKELLSSKKSRIFAIRYRKQRYKRVVSWHDMIVSRHETVVSSHDTVISNNTTMAEYVV